jgi:hypothetical protein
MKRLCRNLGAGWQWDAAAVFLTTDFTDFKGFHGWGRAAGG